MDKSFLDALNSIQELPETSDQAVTSIPDLLSGVSRSAFATKITSADDGKIAGGKEYGFTYHAARLMVGQVASGFDNGQMTFDDIDESPRLKEIVDASLRGESVIIKKQESFLKDGTVVIWVEWMEPKAAPTKEKRDYLSIDELLDPDPNAPKDQDEGSGG